MSDGSKNPRLSIVIAISLCNSSGCRFVIATAVVFIIITTIIIFIIII